MATPAPLTTAQQLGVLLNRLDRKKAELQLAQNNLDALDAAKTAVPATPAAGAAASPAPAGAGSAAAPGGPAPAGAPEDPEVTAAKAAIEERHKELSAIYAELNKVTDRLSTERREKAKTKTPVAQAATGTAGAAPTAGAAAGTTAGAAAALKPLPASPVGQAAPAGFPPAAGTAGDAPTLIAEGTAPPLRGADLHGNTDKKENLSYQVTCLSGDKLDVKYKNGKATVTIPNTDGMSIERKVKVARDMIATALSIGAYKTDKDGNKVFVIRTHDMQLRTALEATIDGLGYKYETPGVTNVTRQEEVDKGIRDAGWFGVVPFYSPVASMIGKIQEQVYRQNLQSHPRYKNCVFIQALFDKKLAKPSKAQLKKMSLYRDKTPDEILAELKNKNLALHAQVSAAFTHYMSTAQAGGTAIDEDTQHAKLQEIVKLCLGFKPDENLDTIKADLENPKQPGQAARIAQEALWNYMVNGAGDMAHYAKKSYSQINQAKDAEKRFKEKYGENAEDKFDNLIRQGFGTANGFKITPTEKPPETEQKLAAAFKTAGDAMHKNVAVQKKAAEALLAGRAGSPSAPAAH